ncbi:unnamed protein product [Caenorhabditis brenneri]
MEPQRITRTRHLSVAEEEAESYLENFYSKNERDNRRVSFVQRGAMNQAQFDKKFDYNKPHKENEVKKQVKKFVRRFYEPFTSFLTFKHFILDLIPILKWLPNYEWKNDILSDCIGGLTVGVMQIPQGIAYALLARQPAINGLYASLIPPLIYMIFGTSRHSSLGTFAVISLMTGITVERLTKPDMDPIESTLNGTDGTIYPSPTEVSCAIAFSMGIILFILAVFRLHILTTFLSDQVVGGFTVGASIHVFVSQIKTLLGIRGLKRRSGYFYLFQHLFDIFTNLDKVNVVCVGISSVSCVVLFVGKEYISPIFKKKTNCKFPIPWELLVVVLATLFVFYTGFNETNKVQIVNEIPVGVPEFSIPSIDLISQVFADAIGITVVSVAIWLSVSKMYAKSKEYQLDAGQELFALSFASIGSSFIPTVPISCSLSRTLVAVGAGVTTQLSILFSSILVLGVVSFLGGLLRTLPMAALSAIICVALLNMFKRFAALNRLWKVSKIDFAIWFVSFASTVILDVSIGLVISVGFALFTTIIREQYPKWHLLASVKGTPDFRDAERYGDTVYFKGICIFRFDAPLLFYNVEVFKKSIDKAYAEWQISHEFYVIREERDHLLMNRMDGSDESANERTNQTGKSGNSTSPDIYISRHFVIDCSGFTFIDYMGVNALREVFSDLRKRRILVYFANAKAPVREMFEKCEFYEFVQKENFYPTVRDAACIARQRQLELGFKDTGYVPEHDHMTEVLSAHLM